jgi:hypothetical protein
VSKSRTAEPASVRRKEEREMDGGGRKMEAGGDAISL